MNDKVKAPSKILSDLDAYMASWKPVADNTRVVIPRRPVPKITTGAANTSKTLAKGASGEAVSELRIRLAGFGGVLPGTEFDDSLEKAVKQFEKDAMGRAETGVVDHVFAARLDRFAQEWPINFEKQLACDCGKCGGFGRGDFKGKYWPAYEKSKDEAGNKYEYPGIHRSVLWAARALMFYATLDHKDKIRFFLFSSGYRCHIDNGQHVEKKKDGTMAPRTSTNHMGKAVDIQFQSNVGGKWVRGGTYSNETEADVEKMKKVAVARMNAQFGWNGKDRFALETAAQGAKTWVHLDVRTWSPKHLDDGFFVKSQAELDGESFSLLLQEGNSESEGES